MDSGATEALRRLRELIREKPASVWLDTARAQTRGRNVLRVSGAFAKQWLETRCAASLREAFGGSVEVVAEPGKGPIPRPSPGRVRCFGPSNEFAARMVRLFVEGGIPRSSLLVLHGPVASGKSLLVETAIRLARGEAFLLDLGRLAAGRGRTLIPRKRIVVADSVELLAGKAGAQRALCGMLDAVADRGGRALLTIRGHPASAEGIVPALRNRLTGGLLLPVEPPTPAVRRSILRERARACGRRLDARTEERLAALTMEEGLDALAVWLREGVEPPAVRGPLDILKDFAASAFHVERALLDQETKRRSVVEARRFVMSVAVRGGMEPGEVAGAFGMKSLRPVREACAWAEGRSARETSFHALLVQGGRVLLGG